jgi:hypothetical protein
MPAGPPWRIPATAPVAVLAAVALAVPASGAAASARHLSQAAHPYQVGHFHAVGSHWNLKVEHLNRNGNADVRRADPLNRAPRPGYRYVFVRVSGKLTSHGIGGLGYDESFRLLVDTHSYAPSTVTLRHGLPQCGVVRHGQVVVAKIPFLVKRSQLSRRMVLRALSQLDWHSTPRFFRTTH